MRLIKMFSCLQVSFLKQKDYGDPTECQIAYSSR